MRGIAAVRRVPRAAPCRMPCYLQVHPPTFKFTPAARFALPCPFFSKNKKEEVPQGIGAWRRF
jgi:hypothetical protein